MEKDFSDSKEHFFETTPTVLDYPVQRTLSYEPQKIGLPKSEERVTVTEHTIPVEQNTAVIRIAEYRPKGLEKYSNPNEPGTTMIIFGGGASPGMGTNIKLAVEAEQALIRQAESGKKIPKITRVLVVSNPSGAAREKQHIDIDNLSKSADLAKQALKQIGVTAQTNTIIMGFSMGGGLAIELAAAYEKEKTEKIKSSTDLILIEPATTRKYAALKMGYHFTLGSYLAAYKRYRKQFGKRKSLILANRETKTSWATIDGIPTWKELVKDALVPHQRHMQYAQAFGLKKHAKFGPDTSLAVRETVAAAQTEIKGRVLMIEMGGARVVNNPIRHMWETGQFAKARERKGLTIKGAETHSYAMIDSGTKDVEPHYMMDQIAAWLVS